MPTFEGKNILEVWDFRLSTAVPQIINSGRTWVVRIYPKQAKEYNPQRPNEMQKPLKEYDTGIATEQGDTHDPVKIAKCYEWLYTVRDDYSRPDIEKLKPLVQAVRDAEAALSAALYDEGSPE